MSVTLIYTFTIYNLPPQLIDATTVSITSFISILQIGMSKWKVCCCIICCKVSEAKFKVWKFHISSLISNRAGNEPSRSSQIQRRPLLHFPSLWRHYDDWKHHAKPNGSTYRLLTLSWLIDKKLSKNFNWTFSKLNFILQWC